MTEQHEDEPGPRPPGDPFGDAMRLVSVVQDWAARTFPTAADGHTGSDCQWCPICQFMAVLRGERPDVTERVAEAGTALASAFRAFVDAATPGPDDAGARPNHAPGPRPRVERIDLGPDPAEQPAGHDLPPAAE